jgi:hypothetical protein
MIQLLVCLPRFGQWRADTDNNTDTRSHTTGIIRQGGFWM